MYEDYNCRRKSKLCSWSDLCCYLLLQMLLLLVHVYCFCKREIIFIHIFCIIIVLYCFLYYNCFTFYIIIVLMQLWWNHHVKWRKHCANIFWAPSNSNRQNRQIISYYQSDKPKLSKFTEKRNVESPRRNGSSRCAISFRSATIWKCFNERRWTNIAKFLWNLSQ